MNFSISKPISVLFISLLALSLSFLILQTPNFQFVQNQPMINTVSAVIVPHFDLAEDSRQIILNQAAEKITPKTIILVAPNHFNAGGYDVVTTDKTWRLTNALLEPDTDKMIQLKIPMVEEAFNREHGIANILSPIKTSFPDAKLIPIIIKPNLPKERTQELAQRLEQVCSRNCLLVASIDFSHYQPGALAEIHDQLSLKASNDLDEDLAWQTEVDSRQVLALAIHWAKSRQTEKFRLFENNNSGKMANAPDSESTSFILGWFERGEKTEFPAKTFMAGYKLAEFKDARFTQGASHLIDLSDTAAMAMQCRKDSDYCQLNQILWNAPFWRETQNGLVVAGKITAQSYELVLLPTNNQGLLKDEAKLAVINRVRRALDAPEVSLSYDYDKIKLAR